MGENSPCMTCHGQKAFLLGEARAAGLTVPPAFVLPATHETSLSVHIQHLEAATDRSLGDPDNPLLLAVRPSAE
ncbi:MAG: hypothetical protein AAFP68_10705, partial [Pseudomonadota bacterium]